MYGSTPSGRLQSYAYYRTNPRPNGKTVRISCKVVDAQIAGLLQSITVAPEDVPRIREVYRSHITQVTDSDRRAKKEKLSRRVSQLREEEAYLARLLIKGKISEETYDRLRLEWLEKLAHAQTGIQDLERDAGRCLDDLEAGLSLLSKAHSLFGRLKEKECNSLLQILLNRIIVDVKGQIKAHELHSPFTYLRRLAEASKKPNSNGDGSRWVTVGTPTVTRTPPSPPYWHCGPKDIIRVSLLPACEQTADRSLGSRSTGSSPRLHFAAYMCERTSANSNHVHGSVDQSPRPMYNAPSPEAGRWQPCREDSNTMHQVVIIDAARSPIGKHNGALSSVRPDDLLASVLKALGSEPGLTRRCIEGLDW